MNSTFIRAFHVSLRKGVSDLIIFKTETLFQMASTETDNLMLTWEEALV